MRLVSELKLSLDYENRDIIKAICKKVKVKENDILSFEILKKGIDARKKPDVFYVLNVAVEFSEKVFNKVKNLAEVFPDHSGLEYEKKSCLVSPVVVGFGPSGMFCALTLALAGLKPIVLEQGKCVDERLKDVQNFWENRKLNVYSNVQFGEGGAGTFSDGKLNTNLNNAYCKKVINELILNGAKNEIYYLNKPHIGTDNLRQVVKNIREKIISLGGKVVFNAKFDNFELKENKIQSVNYVDVLTNEVVNLRTNHLVLAIGHSAFNTFKYLKEKSVEMQKKNFAIGVRIEHPQEIINLAQYGMKNNKFLPNADYKIAKHLPNGRSVFSFCMCPGGFVVGSSSEEESIVTNGMSYSLRDNKFANSALLVNVTPDDFKGDVLEGFMLQRKYEKLAFEIAGRNYNAPAQTVGAFLNDKIDENEFECSFKPNVTLCNISDCLPDFVCESLKMALPELDKTIKGFASSSAVLIAPETRSSCPVQFVRNQNYSCTYENLFACGEGAGFAGGIISSCVDGVKCAESILSLI